MWKKCGLAVSASLSILLALTTPAAASVDREAAPRMVTNAAVEFQIDPRFDHMSRISSSLDIDSLGRASCVGSFTTYDEYDSTITITLQQFKNNRWTDIKEWSGDFTGTGVKYLSKGYYVESGYRYRLVTVVQIWDGATEIEKESCDSPVYDYGT